jgi:tripartite-type tricarboxylate transporter receptor subunit TctC
MRAGGLLLGSILVAALTAPVAAQQFPSKPITLVVPYAPGGNVDISARVLQTGIGESLGQPIIIENRPGAGGTIGANMVAKAAPDGYTILVYGALASANALYSKLPYDTLADFIPVAALGQQPLVVVVSPAKGYKTLADLVAAGKAKPGALNYSTAGVGSASHFGAERLRASAGFEAQHIPFKGAAEAVTDVVAERSDFSVQLPATTLPLLKDGKLAALAVSAQKRISLMPDVPTTIEAGLPANSVYPFYSAAYLPSKTPREIIDKLAGEIAKALREPAVQARLATLGVEPMPMSQPEFAKFLHGDIDANVALVKAAKIPTQ